VRLVDETSEALRQSEERFRMLPIAMAATLVTATKMAFMGFGWGIASIDFTDMSGHAMLAAAIYPVLAVVFVPPDLGAQSGGNGGSGRGHLARGRFARRDRCPFRIRGAERLRDRRDRGGRRDPFYRSRRLRPSLPRLAAPAARLDAADASRAAGVGVPRLDHRALDDLVRPGRPYVRADLHR
jgi:hypothetical protein